MRRNVGGFDPLQRVCKRMVHLRLQGSIEVNTEETRVQEGRRRIGGFGLVLERCKGFAVWWKGYEGDLLLRSCSGGRAVLKIARFAPTVADKVDLNGFDTRFKQI
jgi:hypothetical protein